VCFRMWSLRVGWRAQSRAECADFLYGDLRGKDLPPAFDDLEDYAALEQWSAQDWADLLSK
jgi:hypothetical protein